MRDYGDAGRACRGGEEPWAAGRECLEVTQRRMKRSEPIERQAAKGSAGAREKVEDDGGRGEWRSREAARKKAGLVAGRRRCRGRNGRGRERREGKRRKGRNEGALAKAAGR